MILAAGRGERMRPLTDTVPKALLDVKGEALIVWHIKKLVQNGFKTIIINIAHLGDQIKKHLGNGSKWGVQILYSDETNSGALESAGGIKKALPLLGNSIFLVVNADIFCNYEFDAKFDLKNKSAHLVLVANPKHNPEGDFALSNDLVLNRADKMYTFSGIGYYSHIFFDKIETGKKALAPLLREKIQKKEISGEVFNGIWHDIGTPQRLKEIRKLND